MTAQNNTSKLAIFVEGQTEQIFVSKLIEDIANRNQISIEQRKASGGSSTTRTFIQLSMRGNPTQCKYFVLIVDSGSDSSVASDIRDQYESLSKTYSGIIGLRDVYPKSASQVQAIRNNYGFGIRTKPIKPVLLLAIMEIEAWFLAEKNHFAKLHADLTVDVIRQELGIDLAVDNLEQRNKPSGDLDNIYKLRGLRYTKDKANVSTIVGHLDLQSMFLEPPTTVPEFKRIVDALNFYFAGNNWRE